jgi:hypothetical protein
VTGEPVTDVLRHATHSPIKKGDIQVAGEKKKPLDRESREERGMWLRAFYYIFGTHIIAGWVMLLFYLAEHSGK